MSWKPAGRLRNPRDLSLHTKSLFFIRKILVLICSQRVLLCNLYTLTPDPVKPCPYPDNIANNSVTQTNVQIRREHNGPPVSLLVLRINLDGIRAGAVRAMRQSEIFDMPFFTIQLLDGFILKVATAMEGERLGGVSGEVL